MNRVVCAILAGACAGSMARLAVADLPPPAGPSPPTPTALRLTPLFGEPTGSAPMLPPALAVLPLRLSLLSQTFPIGNALGDGSCSSSAEANSQWGFPLQHQVYLAITPRLVLHGFSQQGCALDAGAGGGLTYSVPLSQKLWIVGSVGAYGLPSQRPGSFGTKTDGRVDLLLRTSPDRIWGFGLGPRGVKITGTW
jgi:hypothetical protein